MQNKQIMKQSIVVLLILLFNFFSSNTFGQCNIQANSDLEDLYISCQLSREGGQLFNNSCGIINVQQIKFDILRIDKEGPIYFSIYKGENINSFEGLFFQKMCPKPTELGEYNIYFSSCELQLEPGERYFFSLCNIIDLEGFVGEIGYNKIGTNNDDSIGLIHNGLLFDENDFVFAIF